MRLLYYSAAVYLSLGHTAVAASTAPPKDTIAPPAPHFEPCTIESPTSGNFFDLRTLNIPLPEESKAKHPRDHSWNTTGYDLGYNFTLNFCGPVIEGVKGFEGVDKSLWGNVSAYYKSGGRHYALGLENSELVFRGRKMVLNYTDGSPCEVPTSKSTDFHDREERSKLTPNLDDDEDTKKPSSGGSGSSKTAVRRKSTVISLLCDKEPLAPTLALSFIGSTDECSYFFEARTPAACPTANVKESVSPASVFGIIVLIGVIVYIVGGCVYSRVVLQQRGWRQLPNYSLWAGIFSFCRDIFIILTTSCARAWPFRSKTSYVQLNGSNSNGGLHGFHRGHRAGSTASNNDSEAENRLIDELNEEWED